MVWPARYEGNAHNSIPFALGRRGARTYAHFMSSKYRAYDTRAMPPRASSRVRPDPDVERRLREVFPEVWARYEWLLAARALPRRPRKLS